MATEIKYIPLDLSPSIQWFDLPACGFIEGAFVQKVRLPNIPSTCPVPCLIYAFDPEIKAGTHKIGIILHKGEGIVPEMKRDDGVSYRPNYIGTIDFQGDPLHIFSTL